MFSKNTEVLNIVKILSPGVVLFHADRQTDMTNFTNAHENGPSLRGHEKRGIIHRNALLYRKTSIRLEFVRIDEMI